MGYQYLRTTLVVALLVLGCGEDTLSSDSDAECKPLNLSTATDTSDAGEINAFATAAVPAAMSAEFLSAAEETKLSDHEAALLGEPQLIETDGLAISELAVARGIESRRPIDPGTTFAVNSFERIYVFLKVSNPSKQAAEVIVSWAPEGSDKERGKVRVSIGAQPRWRTWAYTRTVKKPGRYRVLVRNADEDIIATAPFEITDN